MILRLPTEDYTKRREFSYRLMSDLHIGSIHCDKELIRSELEDARQSHSRVFIAGDVFDMILPKDNKRYVASMYDEAIRNTDAVINASLDLGMKILRPYRDLIDMIGCGNHETSVIKYHSSDIISLLCERLSTPEHKVAHGGYSGAIVATYRQPKGNGTRYVFRYHHGSGGASPVTKGMINFARMSSWVRDADVIWMGHRHTRWMAQQKEERVPHEGDKFQKRNVWHVQTGSYSKDEQKQQLDDLGNYRSDYGIEGGYAPESTGGAKVIVNISHAKHGTHAASQVVME